MSKKNAIDKLFDWILSIFSGGASDVAKDYNKNPKKTLISIFLLSIIVFSAYGIFIYFVTRH